MKPPAVREQRALSHLNITVLGAGYVGLVTAACLARLGHRVTVLEVSAERLLTLRAGRVPFHEPGLAELVGEGLASGKLRVTEDADDALSDRDAILVCVGTPPNAAGGSDPSQLFGALTAIAEHGAGATVVIRSTLPPGLSASIAGRLGRARADAVVTTPEFLREGSAVSDFMAPTRIVIGTSDGRRNKGARLVERIFAAVDAPVIVTDYASADMIKNASNAFLATRLSFINEIADLCEAYGADIDQVLEGMSLDPRIGASYLRPGIGFGGSCLPKDLTSLVGFGRRMGLPVHQLRAASEANRRRADRIASRLDLLTGGLTGRRVALLGLSFKPLTDDMRSSPAVALAVALLARGAHVVAHDPAIPVERTKGVAGLERATDVESAFLGAELVVLATEWPDYLALDWRRMAALVARPFVFDGRNALDALVLRRAGWTVTRIGQAHPLSALPAHDAPFRPEHATNGSNGRAALPTAERAVPTFPDGHPESTAPHAGDHPPPTNPRFLLYSHDAVGLGHVRRNLLLARTIANLAPAASVLVVSGAEGLESLAVPRGVDVLRLPGLRKSASGRYQGRRLKIRADELVRLRAGVLESVVGDFHPHVLVADKHPIGVGGELLPALGVLRRDGGRAALGLRDVLDDPSDAANEWRRAGTGPQVAEFHDMVLVYGTRNLLNPLRDGFLPPGKVPQVHFCGYVVDGGQAGRAPRDLPGGDERPLVLAVTGGGEDGLGLLDTFIEASRTASWRGAVVGGPQLDSMRWESLAARAAAAGVDAYREVHELHRWFPHVDGLVCMGGYNTLLEAVSYGTPTVCVPRIRPRREQLVRARAFAALGLLHTIEPASLTSGRLRQVMLTALRTPRAILAERARDALDLGGADRAAALLIELANGTRTATALIAAVDR